MNFKVRRYYTTYATRILFLSLEVQPEWMDLFSFGKLNLQQRKWILELQGKPEHPHPWNALNFTQLLWHHLLVNPVSLNYLMWFSLFQKGIYHWRRYPLWGITRFSFDFWDFRRDRGTYEVSPFLLLCNLFEVLIFGLTKSIALMLGIHLTLWITCHYFFP